MFGNRAPRLVEIFGVPVEAELAGQMIYIVNTDAPGFIGALGTALGENGINIATFNLGRRDGRRRSGRAGRGRRPDHAGRSRSSCRALPGVREVVPLSF